MKSLRVVFFGTPDFATHSLKAIHQSHHEVVGVVTTMDKASGRGQKMNESSVKKYASEQGLTIFQPEKLRNPEFLEEIKKLDADVFVVVAFRMMPKFCFLYQGWVHSISTLRCYLIIEGRHLLILQ